MPPEPVVPQLQRYLDCRLALGLTRYGTPLAPGNGRDFLIDAFEEAVDMACYLAQGLIERDGHLPSK